MKALDSQLVLSAISAAIELISIRKTSALSKAVVRELHSSRAVYAQCATGMTDWTISRKSKVVLGLVAAVAYIESLQGESTLAALVLRDLETARQSLLKQACA